MATRDETIVKLFDSIYYSIKTEDQELLKNCIINALIEIQNEDDYIKSLALQTIMTCYVRYVELSNYEEDQIILVPNNESFKPVDPEFIIKLAAVLSEKCNQKVVKKIKFITEKFSTLPVFSKFYYNHKELITQYNNHLLYKESNINTLMFLSRAFNQLFYYFMVEFLTYKPYAKDDPRKNFVTVVKDVYLNSLKVMLENVGKPDKNHQSLKDEIEYVLICGIYYYPDKEISLLTFNYVLKAFEYNMKHSKENGIEIILDGFGITVNLDLNFIIVLKSTVEYLYEGDTLTLQNISSSFEKLNNKIIAYVNKQQAKKEQIQKDENKKQKTEIKKVDSINKSKKIKNKKNKKAKNKSIATVNSNKGLFTFLAFLSLFFALCFMSLTYYFTKACVDNEILENLINVTNEIIIKISNDSFTISSISNEQLTSLALVSTISSISCFINHILFWILSLKVDRKSIFGNILLLFINILFAIAKCPLSTLITSICLYKNKEFLTINSKFLKFLLFLLPLLVFVLSIIYI